MAIFGDDGRAERDECESMEREQYQRMRAAYERRQAWECINKPVSERVPVSKRGYTWMPRWQDK